MVICFSLHGRLMNIMWPISLIILSCISFIFIKMEIYSFLFLCGICNKVHEHML